MKKCALIKFSWIIISNVWTNVIEKGVNSIINWNTDHKGQKIGNPLIIWKSYFAFTLF